MSRLTKRENGELYYRQGENYAWSKPINKGNVKYPTLSKLAHYEDLEEQGRLIELPCAVGDTVYIPNERFPAEIDEIRITPNGNFAEYVQYDRSYELTELWDDGSFCIEDIGKEVFFTKKEAEEKLAEMKGAE